MIYYFINLLIFPTEKIKQKSILLIRLDAIGDYVLFRNYIEVLKKSEKYKDYEITLLGNNTWKDLAVELDSRFIYKFIWLDRKKFMRNFIYRYIKLKEITSEGYEVVLSPVYSLEYFYIDQIVNFINAKEKVGSIGDFSSITEEQINVRNKFYTKIIPVKQETLFEFYRNRELFEAFLEKKLDIVRPNISLKPKKLKMKLPYNYAVLFIGANANFRKWEVEYFAKVGKYIKDNYGYDIVICGARNDRGEAVKFAKYFKDDYVDLVGKTSLVDLLYVIDNGNLMISNETSAPHFAVALDVPNIFVLSNGNHYGRFTPYPKKVSKNYHVIFHPKIEKEQNDYKKLSHSYGFGSELEINDIRVEQVINKIDKVLKDFDSKIVTKRY